MPENDEWVYSDGKSTSCVAFILAMYKAAGLFDGFSDSIQVTEFTVCLLSISHVQRRYFHNVICHIHYGDNHLYEFSEKVNDNTCIAV